ncbi:hypothetical protein SP19_76 [Salmonella phage 19]|nr:hypothetical protein SP19_76 [Salmonella phage 19]
MTDDGLQYRPASVDNDFMRRRLCCQAMNPDSQISLNRYVINV